MRAIEVLGKYVESTLWTAKMRADSLPKCTLVISVKRPLRWLFSTYRISIQPNAYRDFQFAWSLRKFLVNEFPNQTLGVDYGNLSSRIIPAQLSVYFSLFTDRGVTSLRRLSGIV